ncbi:hypothetical protein NFI96_002295 [Prochilodus magdalenae]|nr:hypothetical protein NFI96_002295 [Prochilodus magdalenae]
METAGSEPAGAAGGQPSDAMSPDPQQPQTPPTGKLRKTAFRFFGGRRSICMLPSFFGGRGKGQGARGGGGGGGDMTSADFEFHNPNGASDPQKAQEAFGKSQSLPRQRRGLRVPGTQSTAGRHSDDSSSRLVPEKRKSKGKAAEKEEKDKRQEEGNDGDEQPEAGRKGRLAVYRQPLSADSEMARLAEINADLPEGELPPASASSDNVNLIFGDVSSLKSFDSLTGCGDIIADQDDVSVAESGGEEMATPDEVDGDYLHSLWESDVGNEVCYLPSEHTDSLSITPDQPVGSFHITSSSSSGGGNTSTRADEETRERPQPERLPHSHGFLGAPLQGGKGKGDLLYTLTSATLETGAMETEEERLNQVLYCGDCFYSDTDPLEVNCKSSSEEGLQTLGVRPPQAPQVVKEALSHGGPLLRHKPLYEPTSDPRGCSQSQEELMVCFSQALVDFTKNTRLYRNSTESLDGSESSSPFGPSLSALPAIVTFDVVDMENEGECEQQTELAEEEEELSSPYEPFEDDGCYLQQDAFAECDQRTFDAYEQSLLFSNAWGITSLPRHLSLGRPGPPIPAPLALNRRSRSLDTDSLDFQTSEFYASVASHGPKMAPSNQRRKPGPETGDCCDMALPRHPGRDRTDGWRRGHGCEFDSQRKANASSQQQQKTSRGSPWMETTSSCTTNCQQTVRPSHLPLQAACRNSSSSRLARAGAEGELMTGGGDAMYPCSYPPSGAQWKTRPVGVTQGVPHLRSDQLENPRELTAKSRRAEIEGGLEHPHTVPADGAVGVEVEGHQAFWTCDTKPFISVLTTVPPHTDSLGVSTKTKAGLVTEDDPLPF